jgi:chloramphenicol O-acetyltransferase type A
MSSLRPIDVDAWPRAEHFRHYSTAVPCTYAVTVELDATRLTAAIRDAGRKTYPTQIWALAEAVNRHEQFRMGLTDDGAPGVWDVVHPSFTVFNPERETFASVWAPYDPDYAAFHDRAVDLLNTHRSATEMFPQADAPPNTFDVSSLPWTTFTAFSLQIKDAWTHLPPIFTLGRYVERAGRVIQPLAIQIHHAAADGFHTGRLVDDLQRLFDDPDWVA